MLKKIIGRNISILYRHKIVYVDQRLKVYNINKIQAEVLLFIRDNNSVNHKQINDFFLYNKATITKIITSLEDSGYVERILNLDDKRHKSILITEKGRSILPFIFEVLQEWEKIIIKNISTEDVENISSILAQMVENVTEEIEVKE